MNRMVIRISLGVLIAMVVSFVILAGILRHSMGSWDENAPRILGRAVSGIEWLVAEVPQEKYPSMVKNLRDRTGSRVEVKDLEDESIPASMRESVARGKAVWHHPRHSHSVEFYIPLRAPGKVLVIDHDVEFPKANLITLAVMLVSIVFVVLVTGMVLAGPVTRWLRKLETAAMKIGEGDLSARADVCSKGAVGNFAGQFNKMADRVQLLLENQRQLLQSVSHELRTPVARIRFGMEMLADADERMERSKRLVSIDADLEDLEDLIGELLVLSKLDAGVTSLKREKIDVAEIAEAIIGRSGPLYNHVDIETESDGQACLAMADPKLFTRALDNLLGNALRYSCGKVSICFGTRDESVWVDVRDDGPGIPVEAREKVLEPFARLDVSREESSGGAGLGLAIVKRIVDSHGGEIEISAGSNGGTCVTTRWPAV